MSIMSLWKFFLIIAIMLFSNLLIAVELEPALSQVAAGKTWLKTHRRLTYGVFADNLEAVQVAKSNVICGGTNAGSAGLAGGPWVLNLHGKGFIDIRSGEPVPEKTLDQLRANVNNAHRLGFKVLGEVIRMHIPPAYQAKDPDCQVLNSPGQIPLKPEEVPESMIMGCWYSPYGKFFVQSQVELAKWLDLDGYNLDGFGCWMQCYCRYCREGYHRDSGNEIPAGTNPNDPQWRRYLLWKFDRYNEFVAHWTSELKKYKSDFVCAPWSTARGLWWLGSPAAEGTDMMHRVLDAPAIELFWDFPADQGSSLMPAFVCRYFRGVTGDRPAWMLPYLCLQGQFNMQPPKVECDFRNFTVLATGNLVATGLWAQNSDASLAHFNSELIARESFTTDAKSLKYAAMLVDESSRLFYGLPGVTLEVPLGQWFGSGVDTSAIIGSLPLGERRMPAHIESAAGVFDAALQAHLPLDFIIRNDVEDADTLGQYQVLILPNTACLSDKAIENIKNFVVAGGGLVAFHESSLYNEYGDKREDFGLRDLFGVSYKTKTDYSGRWPNYSTPWIEFYLGINKPDLHEITDDAVVRSNYRNNDRVNFIGWTSEVEVIDDETTKTGRILKDSEIQPPIMLTKNYGKGKVVYFAPDFAQAYFIAPYQYQRKLISNAVVWAAATPPTITLDAPLCVQTYFYEQENPKRIIVHLLNTVNTKANTALPENNTSQREETLPIHNITLKVRETTVASATLEPEHIKLPTTTDEEGNCIITVPRLDLHSMVVIETTP